MAKNRTRYETYSRNSKAQIARREFERAQCQETKEQNSVSRQPGNANERSPQEHIGEFARELGRLMMEHNPPLDIKGLAVSSELFTYEHARKLVRGITLPSRLMLYGLARFFGVPSDTLCRLAQRDRLVRQEGADPDLASIISLWDSMSAGQKKIIIDHCTSFASGTPTTSEC
jgi:hypothetical protein